MKTRFRDKWLLCRHTAIRQPGLGTIFTFFFTLEMHLPLYLSLPHRCPLLLVVKNPANAGDTRDTGLIPGLGRSHGVGSHSNILGCKIPRKEEPGRLQSQRVRNNWVTRHSFIHRCPQSSPWLQFRSDKPINLKGNQPWILAGKTDAEAEAPVFWSSDMNSWLIGKAPDSGKDWGQKEKRASEDAGWYHQCSGREFGQTSGDGEG